MGSLVKLQVIYLLVIRTWAGKKHRKAREELAGPQVVYLYVQMIIPQYSIIGTNPSMAV